MAQKIETVIVDDLDGSQAETTVRFGLDGTQYEIDLNTAHIEELHSAFDRYIRAGRKLGSTTRSANRSSVPRPAIDGPSPSDVREWARKQGIEVSDRGRVPSDLVAKFNAANGAEG